MRSPAQRLIDRYPWLALYVSDSTRYLPPEEYDRLLKQYIFAGHSDLNLFERFLTGSGGEAPRQLLELGPGTGRATSVILRHAESGSSLDLVDLSSEMLNILKRRFGNDTRVSFIRRDSVDYLDGTERRYDLVCSLWSFSHSVHQHMIRDGLEVGRGRVAASLRKFLSRNLLPGGRCFLLHVDSCSDEQKILFRQWAKEFTFLARNHQRGIQSPSKLLIDEVLESLESEGIVRWECSHLKGDPIVYESEDEALEACMNFHLETHFNRHVDIEKIVAELRTYLAAHEAHSRIVVVPGCFLYKIERT